MHAIAVYNVGGWCLNATRNSLADFKRYDVSPLRRAKCLEWKRKPLGKMRVVLVAF
jgi:hypothetical protein